MQTGFVPLDQMCFFNPSSADGRQPGVLAAHLQRWRNSENCCSLSLPIVQVAKSPYFCEHKAFDRTRPDGVLLMCDSVLGPWVQSYLGEGSLVGWTCPLCL